MNQDGNKKRNPNFSLKRNIYHNLRYFNDIKITIFINKI